MSEFVRFGLIVTGKGESEFLDRLFRVLTTLAACHFEVIRRVGQLSPRTSTKKRNLRMPGRGGELIPKDISQIGFPARKWLRDHGEDAFVMLIDDLEWDRRGVREQIFTRYREAFNVLEDAEQQRVGVFFLVMMLEAYYFADPAAIEGVLSVTLRAPEGDDVEDKRHPKNELRDLYPGFSEIQHGREIVAKLDLERVLSDPKTCAALRTATAWCHRALRLELGEQFNLAEGALCPVTGAQIEALAQARAVPGLSGQPAGLDQ